jgi:hypothetical protein
MIITSTANSIRIEGLSTEYSKATYRKERIINIRMNSNAVHVLVENEKEWIVSHDGNNGTYQIDSVDGEAPTSLEDLYNKLINLIK